MKKQIGILLAVLLCMTLTLTALAEGEEGADASSAPETSETALPETTDTADAPETTDATDAPASNDAPASDEIVISPATGGEQAYKDLLMDSLDQTLLGKNASLRAQISKILYLDDITVTAENYNHIVSLVQNAIRTQTLSDGAALDHYTDEDFAIAADIIKGICDELGLGYSIDPSNDSQNEYARVITITKDGKVLGKINSDAKTDVGERPSIGWIIGGGVLIAAAVAFAVVLVISVSRKKKAA